MGDPFSMFKDEGPKNLTNWIAIVSLAVNAMMVALTMCLAVIAFFALQDNRSTTKSYIETFESRMDQHFSIQRKIASEAKRPILRLYHGLFYIALSQPNEIVNQQEIASVLSVSNIGRGAAQNCSLDWHIKEVVTRDSKGEASKRYPESIDSLAIGNVVYTQVVSIFNLPRVVQNDTNRAIEIVRGDIKLKWSDVDGKEEDASWKFEIKVDNSNASPFILLTINQRDEPELRSRSYYGIDYMP